MKKIILLITTITLLLFAASLLAEDMMKTIPGADGENVQKAVDPDAERAFYGYLSDVMCGEKGIDPEENDLTQTPEKHTKACMMAEECANSGYGIFVKDEKGTYEFFKFAENGNQMVRDNLLPNTEKEYGIMIIVMGRMNKDGFIDVKSINEAAMENEAAEMKEEEMKEEVKEEIMKKQANEEMKKAEMEKQVPGLKTNKVKE